MPISPGVVPWGSDSGAAELFQPYGVYDRLSEKTSTRSTQNISKTFKDHLNRDRGCDDRGDVRHILTRKAMVDGSMNEHPPTVKRFYNPNDLMNLSGSTCLLRYCDWRHKYLAGAR